MALFETLKKLLGVKPKENLQSNLFDIYKSEAIKLFESGKYEKDKIVTSYQDVSELGEQVSAMRVETMYKDGLFMVVENLLDKNGNCKDGYPCYKMLTIKNGKYEYYIIREQEAINGKIEVEKSIKLEYKNETGFKSNYIYESDLNNGTYDKSEIVKSCLEYIATYKETLKQQKNKGIDK